MEIRTRELRSWNPKCEHIFFSALTNDSQTFKIFPRLTHSRVHRGDIKKDRTAIQDAFVAVRTQNDEMLASVGEIERKQKEMALKGAQLWSL